MSLYWNPTTGQFDYFNDLHESYKSTVDGAITLDSTRGAIKIKDDATPITGNLLELSNNAGTTKYAQFKPFQNLLPGVGTNSTVIGSGASATSTSGIAIGPNSLAVSSNTIAMGLGANAVSLNAIAQGAGAIALDDGIAQGFAANASSLAIAQGKSSSALHSGVASGERAVAGVDAVAVGSNANAATDLIAVGKNAESFGLNGISIGRDARGSGVTVGNSAFADTDGVAIGKSAFANNRAVSLGTVSLAADFTTAVGWNCRNNSFSNGGVNVGYNNTINSFDEGCILLGAGLTTFKDNMCAIGGPTYGGIDTVYIGNGPANTAPISQVNIYSTAAFATSNRPGANLRFGAGAGTGNQTGGNILFTTATSGSSGTNQNPQIERYRITPFGEHRFQSAISNKIKTVTTNTSLVTADHTILVDASAGPVTITLPATQFSHDLSSGREYVIKKIDSTSNRVIVDGNASELIDGQLTQEIVFQYDSMTIQNNGVNWWII